jgi:hypothetical protein
VIHPQADVSAALGGAFSLTAGYEVDIVSGATPALFGANATGAGRIDAITQATQFSDVRHQVKGGFDYGRPNAGVSAGYSYGWESDYKSSAVSVGTRTDMLDHNFTLGIAYTHNFDDVCDANNTAFEGLPLDRKALTASTNCFNAASTEAVTHRLHIDTIEPSLSWTATPRLVLQGGATVQLLDGFQGNPYRSVKIGMQGRTPQEHLPRYRQRYALFTRAAYAFPGVRASLLLMARVYRDSWAVQGATTELNLHKYLTKSVLVSGRGRYHQQTGASFYRRASDYLVMGPGGQYWTGDRELAGMANYLVGGKLAYLHLPEQEKSPIFSELEVSAKMELLLYRLDTPDAPNADRSAAYIWQAALTMRF